MSEATGDLKSYDGSGPWFKIDELGANVTADAINWPADDLTEYSFDIPAATRTCCSLYVHSFSTNRHSTG